MNDTSRASTSHDKSFQGGNRVREVPDSDSEHEEWVDATDKLDEDLVDGDTGLSDEDIRHLLDQAAEFKQRGNVFYQGSNWDHALGCYKDGLSYLPSRRLTDNEPVEPLLPEDTEPTTPAPDHAEPEQLLTELQRECATLRSVLNSNIAACLVKLDDHKGAVAACSEALLDDPNYIKALQRRATSNDILSTWSSLTTAEKDYETLLRILPASSPLLPSIQRAILSLKPRIAIQQKRETDEMMGKLKDLGNNVLGRFGLSTDNFQFTPNGQGGYSMNFVR